MDGLTDISLSTKLSPNSVSIWESTNGITRAAIAQRNYAAALERVRRCEEEAERALEALEKAHREVVKEARFEPVAELSPMFETGWQARRVRLLAEREQAA